MVRLLGIMFVYCFQTSTHPAAARESAAASISLPPPSGGTFEGRAQAFSFFEVEAADRVLLLLQSSQAVKGHAM